MSLEHPLILKVELDANGDNETCAELPKEIKHPMHDQHPLTLHARPPYNGCSCNVCKSDCKENTYNCLSCKFTSCVTCAFEDRVLYHRGHKEHKLTLMQRKAKFKCDACGTKAEDLSYACNSCQFWMHKSCASSPTKVEAIFHPHPLELTYSLPNIYHTFKRKCFLCNRRVHESYWLYYCHKCTYFFHIKCVESSKKMSGKKDDTEVSPQRDVDEHNLVKLPVPNKESFMDLIINQFAKRNINLEEGEAPPDHPQTINHWSHRDHPLILLEELQRSENNEMLICNGCIQPISAAHPFYGCIRCNFFLHIFCVELPMELPAGAHSCHPEHPLVIHMNKKIFYPLKCDACGLLTDGFSFWCKTCEKNPLKCDACGLVTNGFYFWCKTCDMRFDIGCCFLPNRIKHESHTHPLVNKVNCASTKFPCRACGSWIDTDYFTCETACSMNFQIHKKCALFPSKMRHRWDPHPIRLIYPPFPHEGVIYCEICEEEINPNYWFYHCSKCYQSFHRLCLRPPHNVKLGDKVVVGIHPHTLTFVRKEKRVYCRPLLCCSCAKEYPYESCYIFECANCDILLCRECVSSNL